MKLNKKLEEEIILTAYGDANIFTKLKIYMAIIFNKNLREIFFSYRNTKKMVNIIKDKDADFVINLPPDLLEKNKGFWAELYCLFIEKPILPVVYASLIIFALLLSIYIKSNNNRPINSVKYNVAELNEADKKAKYALAVVGEILGETNLKIKEDIIVNKVAEPLNKSLQTINKILNMEL